MRDKVVSTEPAKDADRPPSGGIAALVPRSRFIVSVAINLMLFVSLMVALFVPQLVGVQSVKELNRQPGSAEPALNYSGRTVERALLSAGLDSVRARHLVLDFLEQGELHATRYEYWKPAITRDALERVRAFDRDERVRAALMQEFGTAAKDDAGFASIFRPLANEFPTLSAEEQLRLQRLRIEKLRGLGNVSSQQRIGMLGVESASASAFESALSPDNRFEYQLRTSSLAQALAASGFDFSEREFRDVFRVLSAAQPESVHITTSASLAAVMSDAGVLKQIDTALGAQRFDEFRRVRDPAYGLLRRIAEMHNVPRESVDRAYALVARNQGGAARPGANGNIAIQALDPVVAQKLASVLGADVAAEVVRAFAFYGQAFRAGATVTNAMPALQGRPFRISPKAGSMP